MALIISNDFKYMGKERHSVHKSTAATYSSFYMYGKRYFQIDTYGSKDRKVPEKISQSIQINEEMAKILVDLLKREFNIH